MHLWILWIMVKWIVIMKIQPSICFDDWRKQWKNPSQGGRDRDLNSGPPKFEPSVTTAPESEVAQFLFRRIDSFYYYYNIKDFAASVLKSKISSLIWLTISKFLIFTSIWNSFCSKFFGNWFKVGFHYWTFLIWSYCLY